MSHLELLTFSSPEELAESAATAWLQKLQAAKAPQSVALEGGHIAGRFFSAFARRARGSFPAGVPAHFFWGDERCVPPGDPESNFRLAQESMLQPLRVPETQIHRIRGELAPETAAAQAESELRQFAKVEAPDQPVLDLVFLGMGPEGHTASLFPGEAPETCSSPAVFRPVVATKPPPRRITLGYPALAAAREIWLLASGEGKKDALRRGLDGDKSLPVGRVLASGQKVRVFTDLLKK